MYYEVLDELSLLIDQFASNTEGLNRIAVCTPVAKCLSEHLVKDKRVNDVKIVYMNDLAFTGAIKWERRALNGQPPFENENVLVFFDVMSGEHSLREYARIKHTIEHFGGQAVGAISLIHMQEEHAGFNPESGRFEIDLPVGTAYALTALGVEEENTAPSWVRVDPFSSHPISLVEDDNAWQPVFTLEQTIHDLNESKALSLGLFEADQRLYTCAADINKLLENERIGKGIQSAIGAVIGSNAEEPEGTSVTSCVQEFSIITTACRDNFKFCESLYRTIGHAIEPMSPIVATKYESVDENYQYAFTDKDSLQLSGKHVVVPLASVNTADKVHKLATSLAAIPVKSIHVVCLLSRMGIETARFVKRLQTLLGGNTARNEEVSDTCFQFHALYDLPDLPSIDLARMQEVVFLAFKEYLSKADVPVYKEVIESQCLHVFRAAPLLENTVGEESGRSCVEIVHALAMIIRSRDYGQLATIIKKAQAHRDIIWWFMVICSDFDSVRAAGATQSLWDSVLDQIDEERETLKVSTTTRDRSLAYGIALMSLFDKHLCFTTFVDRWFAPLFELEAQFREPGVDDLVTKTAARRFLEELRDVETTLIPSVVRAFHVAESTTAIAEQTRGELTRVAVKLLGSLKRLPGLSEDRDTQRREEADRQAAENNVNQLLLSLGYYDVTPQNTVEFLQHQLLTIYRPRHNPVREALGFLRDEITELPSENEEIVRVEHSPKEQELFHDILAQVSVLLPIAARLEHFYSFAPPGFVFVESGGGVANGPSGSHKGEGEKKKAALRVNTRRLVNSLYALFQEKALRREEAEWIVDQIGITIDTLYLAQDEESSAGVRGTVGRNVDTQRMPIVRNIDNTLTDVVHVLNELKEEKILSGLPEFPDEELLVMAWRSYFKETVKNFFENIRHSETAKRTSNHGLRVLIPSKLYVNKKAFADCSMFDQRSDDKEIVTVEVWNECPPKFSLKDIPAGATLRSHGYFATLLGGDVVGPTILDEDGDAKIPRRVSVALTALHRPRYSRQTAGK